MFILIKNIRDLIPYENNPRINDNAVEAVANSIREFGFKVPIIIDTNNTIIAGHTRLKACEKLGIDKIPVIIADDLTEEQIKAFRLADNKVSEIAEWDLIKLEEELAGISMDMSMFDFDVEESEELTLSEEEHASLTDKFIVPPFSILDTRQGYWQDRKSTWKKIIKGDNGRDEQLLGKGLLDLAVKQGANLTGTSIFDPVLTEILINWFCPLNGKILDPFAGGSTRGLISSYLGCKYTGIDLSDKQIEANSNNYEEIRDKTNLKGNALKKPEWIVGDSCDIDTLVSDGYDFLLTCPPYAHLEVYSDNPKDISNMSYKDFRTAYFDIISKSCNKLKDNAFASIVVGEVRDKNGHYYDFISDTKKAFLNSGLKLYNDCVLIEQVSTGALRASRQFNAGRKVIKTHQNVLIFIKGDSRKIMDNLKMEEYDLSLEELQ